LIYLPGMLSFTYPSLPWLLEEDKTGIYYVTLRDLVGVPADDSKLIQACTAAYSSGYIHQILQKMNPEGFWKKEGAGYNQKYFSTVWSLLLLAQLGATIAYDERIKKACLYYLDHAYTTDGSISYNGTPSGTVCCLQGNMCAALTDLGCRDERLEKTYEWMAKSVIGKIDRYYSYTCGPCFECGANGKKPCAWGGTKVLLALGKIPENKRTNTIKQAIKVGAEFFLRIDPVTAAYPTRHDQKPSRDWWQFGFPVFYVTDILQTVEALVSVGYGNDPRLKNAIEYIKGKQDALGRWKLEYDYPDKTWVSFGKKEEPNKWVTYRVLKLLKALDN
jgi:hypothetical protein